MLFVSENVIPIIHQRICHPFRKHTYSIAKRRKGLSIISLFESYSITLTLLKFFMQEDEMAFKIKRIYDEYKPIDGWRVLVDRIWLRGISKKEARLNQWVKELAPSTELREWYCHIPEKFDEFTV